MRRSIPALAALSLAMTAAFSITALANWHYDEGGYFWENEEGDRLKSQWAWLDGNQDGISECYYFGEDGYMLSSAVTPDGYEVDASGAWVVSGVIQTKVDPSVASGQDAAGSDGASQTDAGSSDAQADASSSEAPASYTVGSLTVQPQGEFAGSLVIQDGTKLTMADPASQKTAIVLYVDMTQDPEYQEVMQSAQALGVDLNSDVMRSMVIDIFISSFASNMGSQPIITADLNYPSGSWRQLRYDPSAMEGAYTDILVRYDNNVFYAIVFGGLDGYVDIDAFMNNCIR